MISHTTNCIEAAPVAVVQQADYSLAGVDDFHETVLSGMMKLLDNSHLINFIPKVLAEAVRLGAQEASPTYKLLSQRNFAGWNESCASLVAEALPMGAGLSKEAKFCGLINAYQGKYEVPELSGKDDRRHLVKNASRVGSEQLLRRLFVVGEKVLFNAFGGAFLAKIQELPFLLKFWLLLRNIVEVVPRMKAGEDVTINYFAQLFVIKTESGKNMYDGLQEAMQELWGCRFQAEAMDLEQKIRKEDEPRLQDCLEQVVLAHPNELSFDDFGDKHPLWKSKHLSSMQLKEVKMSAEMKAKVVDQDLKEGKSSLLEEWIEKVQQVGSFQCVVLEGSDNCGGMHPGVIFTDETRSNKSLPWADHLQKYTQVEVEDAHANVVEKIQSAVSGKPVRIQGGFGVLDKEVDGAFASVCAQLGQGNVASTLGSSAWLTWAKGHTRVSEMGLYSVEAAPVAVAQQADYNLVGADDSHKTVHSSMTKLLDNSHLTDFIPKVPAAEAICLGAEEA